MKAANPDGGGSSTMRSLERALGIFDGLQRTGGPQRLTDIAGQHGMSAATVLRILRVLKTHGLVAQTDAGYHVGAAALPAAQAYLQDHPLPILGIPILDELARVSGLTASLYTRSGAERILVARSDGQHPLRYTLPFGVRLPLTLGAAGKVLLSEASDDELLWVVEESKALGYEPALLTVDMMRDRLGDPRLGYASSQDERATGVISIGVSVPRRGQGPTESLSLTSPTERMGMAELEAHAPELRRAAQMLGQRLAGSLY